MKQQELKDFLDLKDNNRILKDSWESESMTGWQVLQEFVKKDDHSIFTIEADYSTHLFEYVESRTDRFGYGSAWDGDFSLNFIFRLDGNQYFEIECHTDSWDDYEFGDYKKLNMVKRVTNPSWERIE